MKARGAEIVFNPSYGMWRLDNEWWMRTRSYENELFWCFAHPHAAFICGPRGEMAAKLQGSFPDVLLHQLDLYALPDTMFGHRRPDLYDIGAG